MAAVALAAMNSSASVRKGKNLRISNLNGIYWLVKRKSLKTAKKPFW